MTGMSAAVQPAAPLEAPERVAATASSSRSTASATPTCGSGSLSAAVSVAVGLRFFGHYYMQLLPPLALLAAGALSRGSRVVRPRRAVAFALVVGVVFSAAGYFFHPVVPEPNYESVTRYLADHHQPRRPDLRVGQRARDLLGVGPPPGDALPHVVVPHRQLPGPSAGRRQHRRRHQGSVGRLLRGLHRAPAASTSSTRHRRRCAARSTTRSRFPRLEHIVDTQYRYVVTIDGIDVYKRK